ncbi:MAG: AAA family ATPase, partial [Dehalococcoidia bacterium]
MYLKKLTIQGFKSFASRTTFEFRRGVTAVVGPNGSGKSNVSDAIRWVLGEQSSRLLRARRQEDVIFAGGGERAAVGMAEVTLTLDNEDGWLPLEFNEIQLGRRLYRDGDSEYLLNGSRVRLRDLTDLLLQGKVGQNSYTIMGQGLVDEVLVMSAVDRRGMVDEAADVRRYRVRVQDAQDRLKATRANLDRVALVLGEIEPRLRQLRRQAERAADHTRLAAELIELLTAYYGETWADTQNRVTRARANLDQKSAETSEARQRTESLEGQLRTLSEEIKKRREALAQRQTRGTDL